MTTTALSVIIPTAIIRAPIVMISKAKPARCMQMTVAIMDIGIVEPTISEPLISPKKIKIMIMERSTACTTVFATPDKVSIIVSAISSTTSILSSGYFALRSSSTGSTCLDRVTDDEDCFLLIPMLTSSIPMYLESESLSDTAYFTVAISFKCIICPLAVVRGICSISGMVSYLTSADNATD